MKKQYLNLIKKYVYPITFCDDKFTNFSYRCALIFHDREVISAIWEDECELNESLKLIFLTDNQDRVEALRDSFLNSSFHSWKFMVKDFFKLTWAIIKVKIFKINIYKNEFIS
jgi:hypothetical protein